MLFATEPANARAPVDREGTPVASLKVEACANDWGYQPTTIDGALTDFYALSLSISDSATGASRAGVTKDDVHLVSVDGNLFTHEILFGLSSPGPGLYLATVGSPGDDKFPNGPNCVGVLVKAGPDLGQTIYSIPISGRPHTPPNV
jgi:hypothetical protein